jgi:hypothetical protein
MVFSLFVVMIQMIPAKVKAIKEKKKYQAKSVLHLGVCSPHYLYWP